MKATAFSVVFAAAVLMVIPATTSQQILKVPSQYQTIQAAIDAARDNDTVLVDPGTYREQLKFWGKPITVRSSMGPDATILAGDGTKPVVIFLFGETNRSVLDGFTIRDGGGSGIRSLYAPTIQNNIITQNQGCGIDCQPTSGTALILFNRIVKNTRTLSPSIFGTSASGGGIRCQNSLVYGNFIADNTLVSTPTPWVPVSLSGGGIACMDSLVINNVVVNNIVTIMSQTKYTSNAYGGGISAGGTTRIINNTIVGNIVTDQGAPEPHVLEGGGLYAGSSVDVVNTILRDNYASLGAEVGGTVTSVTYSNIERGHTGKGNIDSDARFTSDETYHLRPNSPCRDVGSKAYLNFSASDLEWDDRGWGGGVDIGADEFAPHVYHHGDTRRGKTFTLTVIGAPREPVLLGYAANLARKPISIPGAGILYLDPRTLQLMPLGTLPVTGHIDLKLSIPLTAPLVSVPFQALVGNELTRPETIQVAP